MICILDHVHGPEPRAQAALAFKVWGHQRIRQMVLEVTEVQRWKHFSFASKTVELWVSENGAPGSSGRELAAYVKRCWLQRHVETCTWEAKRSWHQALQALLSQSNFTSKVEQNLGLKICFSNVDLSFLLMFYFRPVKSSEIFLGPPSPRCP